MFLVGVIMGWKILMLLGLLMACFLMASMSSGEGGVSIGGFMWGLNLGGRRSISFAASL